MEEGIISLAQSVIDICAWFLPAFAIMLAVSWLCHLFRY